MQKLFDFYPSAIKPMDEFFKNSDCDIIRNYDGRRAVEWAFMVESEAPTQWVTP